MTTANNTTAIALPSGHVAHEMQLPDGEVVRVVDLIETFFPAALDNDPGRVFTILGHPTTGEALDGKKQRPWLLPVSMGGDRGMMILPTILRDRLAQAFTTDGHENPGHVEEAESLTWVDGMVGVRFYLKYLGEKKSKGGDTYGMFILRVIVPA